MPKVIKERNLTFTFPDDWHVVKYDEENRNVFYQKRIKKTGSDLSAVDFVVRNNMNELLLIEVKDFRGYARQNRSRQAHGELAQEVVRNAMHTLSGLYLGAARQEANFSPFAHQLPNFPARIHFILFMEDDPMWKASLLTKQNQDSYRDNMVLKLRNKLQTHTGIRTKLRCIADVEARDGFTVA